MKDIATVGVTGVHTASAPKSGAVVLKELALHSSIRPIALVDYPQTCALGWDSLKLMGVYQVPQGIMGAQPLTGRLLEINQKTPLNAVIPCDDEDVAALAIGAQELAKSGIATLLPLPDAVEAVKKTNFHKTLSSCGLSVPSQATIWDLQDVTENTLGPPIVVKGRIIHAYLARNSDEVQAFAAKLCDVWGYPVILQKFIEGAEFSVTAVADRNSDLVGICAIRKLGISDQGKTWLAVTISPKNFEPLITSLLKKLQWVGPLEIEFIIPSDGSSPVAIEINPRFPAWIPLARSAGADLVDLAVKLCLGGENSELLVAQPGMCFARTYHTNVFAFQRLAKFYAHQEFVFKEAQNQ